MVLTTPAPSLWDWFDILIFESIWVEEGEWTENLKIFVCLVVRKIYLSISEGQKFTFYYQLAKTVYVYVRFVPSDNITAI
jgi:hypothetical protein